MKIKQKIIFNLVAVFAVTSGLAVLLPAPSAEALTQAEKKQCYERWAGRSTGSAGDGQTYNPDNFADSKCSKGQNPACGIARYSDGSSVYCVRKDGKYDNRENNNAWNRTTGGFDSMPTGDAAPDTPIEEEEEDPDAPVGQGGDGCGGADTAIIKCSQDNSGGIEQNGVWGILVIALTILTAGVGIVAVGGIAYGAILYASAGDRADQVKKGMDVIKNVVIGIILYAAMYAILDFIIPGGIIG